MKAWQPDRFLPGFESLELEFPDDYDGRALATMVRLPAGAASRGAVLWVHGFIDYFFQRHVAERFAMEGYAFYALDLRKHGRSLRQAHKGGEHAAVVVVRELELERLEPGQEAVRLPGLHGGRLPNGRAL